MPSLSRPAFKQRYCVGDGVNGGLTAGDSKRWRRWLYRSSLADPYAWYQLTVTDGSDWILPHALSTKISRDARARLTRQWQEMIRVDDLGEETYTHVLTSPELRLRSETNLSGTGAIGDGQLVMPVIVEYRTAISAWLGWIDCEHGTPTVRSFAPLWLKDIDAARQETAFSIIADGLEIEIFDYIKHGWLQMSLPGKYVAEFADTPSGTKYLPATYEHTCQHCRKMPVWVP